MRFRLALLVCSFSMALGLSLAPEPAGAHSLTRSFATWTLPETASETDRPPIKLLVRVAWKDIYRVRPDLHPTAGTIVRVEEMDRSVAALVRERYTTTAGGRPCIAGSPKIVDRNAQWLRVAWAVDCGDRTPLAADVDAFFSEAPGHLVLLQTAFPDAAPSIDVLTHAQRAWPLARQAEPTNENASGLTGAQKPRAPFSTWLSSGMRHVIGGLDHVAFLLALLLLGGGLGVLLRIVTAFTIAHSITLGATVLGIVSPQAAAVETWVGLSILLVAAEALWRRVPSARQPVVIGIALLHAGFLAASYLGHAVVAPDLIFAGAILSVFYLALAHRLPAREARLRTAAAFVFGLIHGFAFAGALLGGGPVPGEPWRVLLGFNLGVETGQLLVVALAWPLLRLIGTERSDLVSGTIGALLFVGALALTALHGLGLA